MLCAREEQIGGQVFAVPLSLSSFDVSVDESQGHCASASRFAAGRSIRRVGGAQVPCRPRRQAPARGAVAIAGGATCSTKEVIASRPGRLIAVPIMERLGAVGCCGAATHRVDDQTSGQILRNPVDHSNADHTRGVAAIKSAASR
ncbi:hypothetical protein MMON_38520 [Mycolicibacterium monacense]|uniref:Uncharacterized protein n=1 Tax=Mycolicibacterium monacense TaxID=85693 RepID=A0AAD1J1W7_MYCMB|nr:hypothetical protein MMON_38520 [Mycolicibacterium monacense]